MSRDMTQRAVAWVKDEPLGVEFAELELGARRLSARGVAVGSAPLPYRLDYELETGDDFVTARLRVTSRGEGWRRELELQRGEAGWTVAVDEEGDLDLPSPGGEPALLADALDCDLELSPVTNTMPIRRHRLLGGGDPVELTAAWVSVPALTVEPDRQRYRPVRSGGGRQLVRFEAVDGSFAAQITLDGDGLVLDYPGIARRLTRHGSGHV